MMVWPCHEEGGRVTAEGCDEVKDEGKETKTKVAIQHLKITRAHILKKSLERNVWWLKDIDFSIN